MSRFSTGSQSGMVLLFCLMFLTALTLLGLSASTDTIMQRQLATNLQQTEQAKQTARATLSWAEEWLLETQGTAPQACVPTCEGFTLHPAGKLTAHPEFESLDWWQTHGNEAGIDPVTAERLTSIGNSAAEPALWIIELIHDLPATGENTNPELVWYRLLARGSGQTDSAISVVESIVAKSRDSESGSSTQADGRVAWRELR